MSNPPVAEAPLVHIDPPELVERHSAEWDGLRAELVTAKQRAPFHYRFKADHHLLVASEYSERDDGETSLEGVPTSTLRSISGRLSFVPAGHEFSGWQQPRVRMRVSYFYADPNGPLFDDASLVGIDFKPRLFFNDPALWQLAGRLKDEAVRAGTGTREYGEALSVMLVQELIRLNNGNVSTRAATRGGLSGWQQKRVAEFIEAHLAEDVPLSALAELVDLSLFHFARAFKQAFGVPPHRYHVGRRMKRAKALLAEPDSSITAVALAVGFAETSSFSAAFRKTTGLAPSEFRRALG